MTPLISIIVPIFNREHYVEQLLHTVKAQTYKNWELILVDDNSTDNTVNLIADYQTQDARIKCITNENKKGASGARNTGLDFATGKYIAYQDSDDEWVESHLETMIHYLETYPNDIDIMSANPLRKYRESGDVFNYDQLELAKYTYKEIEDACIFDEELAFNYQLQGRIITTQCIVARREKVKAIRWNESLRAATDNMYNLQLAAAKLKVGHIQKYHAIYWAHDDNITNCGGNHDAARMEKVQLNFVNYWRTILDNFQLTAPERKYVKRNLSDTLAWHYAYATLEPQKKYRESINIYFEAFLLEPTHIKKFYSFIKAIVKSVSI